MKHNTERQQNWLFSRRLVPPTQSFGWRNIWKVPNRYIIEQKSCFLSLNDIKNSIQFLIFQTHTLWFADYITKDEGLYTVTASNLCGSISYSVIVRILEDEQEYDWMVYRRSKQIVPRTKGFDKFYHTCEEIGRGTQVIFWLKPNSRMYPFSEKLLLIFLALLGRACALCSPRAARQENWG